MPEREAFFHYLPISNLAMHWGIYVTGAGFTAIPPGREYPPKRHPTLYDFNWTRGRTLPEFALVYVSDGQGTFESRESGETAIGPGWAFFLVPGVWHRYRPDPQTGWTERWIAFNGEVTHRLVRSLGFPRACLLGKVRNPEHLAARFDELLERIHFHPTQNSVLLSMYAMALLAEALEHSSLLTGRSPKSPVSDGESVNDDLVVRARELIWTFSHRNLSVAQIARELAITRRTLERRFQAATGSSLLTEITACRVSRAKRLLDETDLPAKAVAYLAGFGSEERMRLILTQLTGLTPGKYRDKGRRHKTRRQQPRER